MACEREQAGVKKFGAENDKAREKRREWDRKIGEAKSARWEAMLEVAEGFPLNPAKSSRGVKHLMDLQMQLKKLEASRQAADDDEAKTADEWLKAIQAFEACRKKKPAEPPKPPHPSAGVYRLTVALTYQQRDDYGPQDYQTSYGDLTFTPVQLPAGIASSPQGAGFSLGVLVGSGQGSATRVLPPGTHPPGCTENWHGSVGTVWLAIVKKADEKLLMLTFGFDPSSGPHAAEKVSYSADCINQPGAYPAGRMRPDLIRPLSEAMSQQLLLINLPEPPTKKNVQLVPLNGAEWTLAVERTD